MESPAPSSSRSPRSRLVIGGRLVPAQPASQVQQQQQEEQMVTDNDRTAQELRAVDCNLSALCDHIQIEGFNAGVFSDVVVIAMGVTYRLHRLILSRSSYFRNMLHGPWKEADAPTVRLQIDDDNVNSEAVTMSLAYLYGHHPKLNDSNAFRVLAAASFLDLQDLCAICTDFIIAELWTSNFLEYQVFAESQDYGVHGERVRKACWGYLCQSGSMELREVLPRLSSQTIYSLLTSDRLWVPSEEKRFELALHTLLAKGELHKENHQGQDASCCELGTSVYPDSSDTRKQKLMEDVNKKLLVNSEVESISIPDNLKGRKSSHNNLVEFSDFLSDVQNNVSCSKSEEEESNRTIVYSISEMVASNTTNNPFSDRNTGQDSCLFPIVRDVTDTNWMVVNGSATEGPSEESSRYNLNGNIWLPVPQSRQLSSGSSSCSGMNNTEWGKFGASSPSWGPRTVGWRQGKSAEENSGLFGEELDAFINIFEGGSLLYCNISFEALLNARKQLEELGFPCKAVNDGLWLQMLLSHKIQEVGADTCRNCCMTSMSCACRRLYGLSQSSNSVGYYRQEHDQNIASDNVGSVYLADAQGEGAGTYGSVRVHARVPIDGLAGIGRGATFVPDAAWPPTRVVFSRVPFGLGNRNNQQSLGNDESEARIDINGNLPGDGLTALVGSSQGGNVVPLHIQHAERGFVSVSTHNATTNNIPLHMLETQEDALGLGWESWDDSDISTLSLDMKTPLRQFPPFRFGVEFQDIHKLGDGQVKHSPEVFYAGSLWKVSVQAFNDEDPQGRRTLGLFLHRRKAEPLGSLKKVHMYIDSREKVTARYQLICPSKRELMVFGSLKQPGTLLPKAPKGWGWRTALLFDELADLLQSGSLRIAAVVQLI